MCIIYYDRTEVSERIDADKTSESKNFDICHYWYFLNKGFKFQPNICNRCHDLLMVSKSAHYDCVISRISKVYKKRL